MVLLDWHSLWLASPTTRTRSLGRGRETKLLASVSGTQKSRVDLLSTPRKAARITIFGAGLLMLFIFVAPLIGTDFSYMAQILAFVIAVLATGALLFGFPSLVSAIVTPWLLGFGAFAAVLGGLAAIFARPDVLAEGWAVVPLIALFVSNLLRISAAAALGISLARHVASPAIALLIAAVAAATDLFSVFAGPTKAMVEKSAPALDFLLVIFPTFGQALGFALGISDFIFLALFIAMSLLLNLRHIPTTVAVCVGTLLAMITSLLLERPLPALPFISLAFVLANADLILSSLLKRR